MSRRVDTSHDSRSTPIESQTPTWLRHAPIAVGLALLIVVPLLFVSRGEKSEWNDCFVTAAHHFAVRESICNEGESYAYPPSMAFWSFGIGVLPLKWSLFVWGLVNVVATGATFVGCWRLIGGPRLNELSYRWWGVALVGGALAVRWIVSPLEHQQFDMVIAACVVWGCLKIVEQREWTGGVLVGLGASMKLTPLLFAPYLAWRGRWRAATMVALGAVAWNVLPDVVWPQRDGGSYVVDWYRVFVAEVRDSAPGTWHSDVTLNQSLGGLFNRLWRVGLPTTVADLAAVEVSPEAARGIKYLTHGTGLLLLAITALIGGRPFRAPAADANPTRRDWLWSVEFAAIMTLMLLLSPMSSKAHYVVLWLPSLVIARQYLARPTAVRGMLVTVLLITGTLTTKGLIGKSLGDLTLVWGLPTWHAILTLVALWEIHWAGQLEPVETPSLWDSTTREHSFTPNEHSTKVRDVVRHE